MQKLINDEKAVTLAKNHLKEYPHMITDRMTVDHKEGMIVVSFLPVNEDTNYERADYLAQVWVNDETGEIGKTLVTS